MSYVNVITIYLLSIYIKDQKKFFFFNQSFLSKPAPILPYAVPYVLQPTREYGLPYALIYLPRLLWPLWAPSFLMPA